MRIYKVRLKITDKQTDKNQYPGKQPKSFSVGRESKKVLLSVGNVPDKIQKTRRWQIFCILWYQKIAVRLAENRQQCQKRQKEYKGE